MGRYLKSLSMKGLDGKAVKIPSCCINCEKSLCKMPCDEYVKEMGDTRCARFEMEFGFTQDEFKFWKCKTFWVVHISITFLLLWCSHKMGFFENGQLPIDNKAPVDSPQRTVASNVVTRTSTNVTTSQSSSYFQWEASNRILALRRDLYGF